MARLLGEGGLEEETRSALLEAGLHFGRALAVENRIPEPKDLDQALLPPLSSAWGAALKPFRGYIGDATTAWKPVAEQLEKL